jgi:RimJ/RimL family protein N-acetyltransferase
MQTLAERAVESPRAPAMGPRPSLADLLEAPPTIRMVPARPEHAEFIHGLRIDPEHSRHLSAVTGGPDAQRRYLERYLHAERAGAEYYFVIVSRKSGVPCGTVRVYDLRPGSFSWGSWILAPGRPRLAAVESALFVYDLGFGLLDFPASHFEVRKENTAVIQFHERLGARRVGEDDASLFFELRRDAFVREQLPALTTLAGYRPVCLPGGA